VHPVGLLYRNVTRCTAIWTSNFHMHLLIVSHRKAAELIKTNVLHEAHNFTSSAPSETKPINLSTML
jgi:hypothetical protein